jgi:hypothetical protein
MLKPNPQNSEQLDPNSGFSNYTCCICCDSCARYPSFIVHGFCYIMIEATECKAN